MLLLYSIYMFLIKVKGFYKETPLFQGIKSS